jgi:hypothetical protein
VRIEKKSQFFLAESIVDVYVNGEKISSMGNSGGIASIEVLSENVEILLTCKWGLIKRNTTLQLILTTAQPHITFWWDRVSGKIDTSVTGATVTGLTKK